MKLSDTLMTTREKRRHRIEGFFMRILRFLFWLGYMAVVALFAKALVGFSDEKAWLLAVVTLVAIEKSKKNMFHVEQS